MPNTTVPAAGEAMPLSVKAISDCIEDMAKAHALVRAVCLALGNPGFDGSDVDAAQTVLWDAEHVMGTIMKTVRAAYHAEIDASTGAR